MNQSIVSMRELFKTACLSSAAAILILHNHPTGDPTPSREDLDITRRIYGLDGAIDAMKEKSEVYVVEGYIDLMQMRAAGIPNVVATCGTAFTREHAAILKRYVRRLNLMFDGDGAGRKALQKGILLAVKEEMKASVFIFPEEQDPDSFYKDGGKTGDLVAMSGFDYLKQSGIEMNAMMQNLHRLERLENGFVYMAKTIPDVARLLAKRGNLGELFSPEVLPVIEETLTNQRGVRK